MTATAGVLALAIGFASSGRIVPPACPTPHLEVEASASTPKQGAIVAVTLRSDVPLSRVTLSGAKGEALMEPADARGNVFRALWGFDFESGTGPRALRIESIGACGDTHGRKWSVRVASGRFPSQTLRVDPAYVEPPPGERERIQREREKVGRLWAAAPTPRRWSGPFGLPVKAPVRANFGARRLFNGKPRSSHNGVDLAAGSGAPVTAPAESVVVLAEDLYFSGGTVILDHGGGLFTTYFHLSRIDVKPGDRIGPGDSLGAVGATGRATGPHLHWGARVNGARVNPLDLLRLPGWPPAR